MIEPKIWTPYCGAAPSPGELLARWNFDPLLLAGFAAAGGVYFYYLREPRARHPWFLAAAALLAVLFVSPFCALSSALFSARVVHHVLLTAVAAPLLVLAFSPRIRLPGGLGGWTAGHALIFWLWHAPPVYAWALSSDAAYWLMQASLLLSAAGFWHGVRRAAPLAAVGALLATMVQMGLLGALITFSGAALYAPHFIGPQLWGFSPLEDQQLAGLIMWAPAAGLYLAAAVFVLGRWLRREAARPVLS